MSIDGPVVAEEVVAPYVGQEFVSGKGDVLVFHRGRKEDRIPSA